MQAGTKMRVLRGLGGLVAAMAVIPWLGAGAAQASSSNDGSCSTTPSGVSAGASCDLLVGPNGKTVFGETWVVRTKANQLKVKTFPINPPDGTDGVSLCLSTSPYPAKHQCNAGDADAVYTGNGTVISVALSGLGITPTDKVYYSLSVLQASTTAVSNGNGGSVPTTSPSASATETSTSTATASATKTTTATASPSRSHTHTPTATPSTSVSASHTHTHTPTATPSTSVSASHTHTTTATPSVSVSASHTSKSPSTSVSATKTHKTDQASPSTSVLAVKLAHTGATGTASALVLSIGLLALGAILVAAGQSARPQRRH